MTYDLLHTIHVTSKTEHVNKIKLTEIYHVVVRLCCEFWQIRVVFSIWKMVKIMFDIGIQDDYLVRCEFDTIFKQMLQFHIMSSR